MKTESLLLVAGLVLGGLVASEDRSFAIIGYVNITNQPGLNLISNPLNATNNNANLILQNLPDGSVLFRFDPGTQYFKDAATYFAGFGWFPVSGNTNDPALVLEPGEGFFIRVSETVTITFTGEVLQGSLTNPIPANYSLKASMVPDSGGLQGILEFPATMGDLIWRWNATDQIFTSKSPYSYYNTNSAPCGMNWCPAEPLIDVGEGFFVHRDPILATMDNWWIRNYVQSTAGVSVSSRNSPSSANGSPEAAIRHLTISGGVVTLEIHNPRHASYDVQFSTDGVSWKTVTANQTGNVWEGTFPGGTRGYYQLVNP